MATEGAQPLKSSFIAGADLSAKQYHFVKLSADKTVVICAGATDVPVGVLQNNPVQGQSATVAVIGVTKIKGNGAISAGTLIGTANDGTADAKVPGTDTTEYVVGVILAATTAAGGLGTAAINCASPARAV